MALLPGHKHVTVIIDPWEYERANDVGIRRYTQRWNSQDAPHYQDKSRQEENRTANVAAAICELAVAKYLNQYWHGHIWHESEHDNYKLYPDVGQNIEVKRIRVENGYWVPVRKSGNKIPGLVVWAAHAEPPEFREVEIYGWVPQETGWANGIPGASYDKKDEVRLYPLRDLCLPEEYIIKHIAESLELAEAYP